MRTTISRRYSRGQVTEGICTDSRRKVEEAPYLSRPLRYTLPVEEFVIVRMDGPAQLEWALAIDHDQRHLRRPLHSAERLWQRREQVCRNQRVFPHRLARHIARQTVEVDRGDHRLGDAIRILSDHTCDHAGQYVAGASRRHAGIARGVHPDCAVGLRNYGSMALEDNNQLMFTGKTAGYIQPVALHGG